MSAIRWEERDGVLELTLERPPLNEIGSATLAELERFLPELARARALLVSSSLEAGFCAGADLRELFAAGKDLAPEERAQGVRGFLTRIHAVLDAIDRAPIPTFAAVHGVVFGGGFELALACDLVIADRTARFAFPELRLGEQKRLAFDVPAGWTTAIVVLHGTVLVNDSEIVREAQFAVLDPAGSGVVLEANNDATILVLCGQPLDEPVVGHGLFVMNTRTEIIEAIQ